MGDVDDKIETKVQDSDEDSDFFTVHVPDILGTDTESAEEEYCEPCEWEKILGWYNELNFYSRVFQFFGEHIKEKESMFGWWIILISSLSSFLTLLTIEPFNLTGYELEIYNWGKSVGLSSLSIGTTLIASWVKKKNYITRIQIIDKRVARLEKFLAALDYQARLVPKENRDDYFKFITKMKDEYNELSTYSNIIRPSEFSKTVYIITRYHAPTVRGMWPWYDTKTNKPRREFAQSIIRTYESQNFLCRRICRSKKYIDKFNPLLK